MHYPTDVLAGVALGACIGKLVPGLGAAPTEERMFELAMDANERAQARGRAGGNGCVASSAVDKAEDAGGPTSGAA
jgi:hypothetical protein